MNHGAVQIGRTRQLIVPLRILFVHCDFIPLNAFTVAALWLWLACISGNPAAELFGKQMVLIPVLRNPWVTKSRQHGRTRTGIIGWQNRLPHGKYTNPRVAVSLQNIFDCGRPPQTYRSSWRKQKNHAHLTCGSIEGCTQLLKVC